MFPHLTPPSQDPISLSLSLSVCLSVVSFVLFWFFCCWCCCCQFSQMLFDRICVTFHVSTKSRCVLKCIFCANKKQWNLVIVVVIVTCLSFPAEKAGVRRERLRCHCDPFSRNSPRLLRGARGNCFRWLKLLASLTRISRRMSGSLTLRTGV